MCEADNLTTFMCRMSWKSGSLNLLEPSGHTGHVTGLLYLLVVCVCVRVRAFVVTDK